MKFSIITICYNEEKRIQKTLESIYCQKYMDYEHIIEDGCSTDKTMEIVSCCSSNYPKDHFRVYSEKDNGLYDAMNRAVARVKGDYICFINSGDYLFNENTLNDVAEQIEISSGMDWYYGTGIVMFPNGDEYFQIPGTIENVDGNDISERLRKENLNLLHQAIFAHRDCFLHNMFDTKYCLRAELKWYYQCLLSKRKVKRLDFPVCRYSVGGLSERADSVVLHAKEIKRIFREMKLLTAENESMLPKENNYAACYKNIYSQWLALHQAGMLIADYLKRKNVRKIAIYGYGELGAHLINELKNTEIEIVCLIDQQNKFPFSGIKVVKPDEFDGNVNWVITTPLLHFREIKEYLNKRNSCRIVSLEDVLEDMWK